METTVTSSLSERLFGATIQTLELYSVYLGKKLGLYRTLSERGPLTAPLLAAEAGITLRYALEWLEQQAVAGFLAVEDVSAAPQERRYSVPADHVGPLCREEDPEHVAPFAQMVVGIAGALPQVADAYRHGGGVAYERYGADFCHGQGGINRPAFLHDLSERWLPSIPDIHDRLQASPPARVVDVGCGEGWSTIGIARAYPRAEVLGCDLDAASIEEAVAHARRSQVKVEFTRADAVALADHGPFDLAIMVEVLHDMSRPVEVLAALRRALAPGGSVIVVDERVEEKFSAPGGEIERMMYGWSVSHCLPVSMSEQPSAAIGTVIRPSTVRACAERAGFSQVEVLPIDNLLFRFYRLRV